MGTVPHRKPSLPKFEPTSVKKIALLPNHIAIIVDGNRRWAKKHKLPKLAGHRAALKNLHAILEYFGELQITYVTLYLFSTENWKRSQGEVKGLFKLFQEGLDKDVRGLHKRGVRLCYLGQLGSLPPNLQLSLKH